MNSGRGADQKPLWQSANYLRVFLLALVAVYFYVAPLLTAHVVRSHNIDKQCGVSRMTAAMVHPPQWRNAFSTPLDLGTVPPQTHKYIALGGDGVESKQEGRRRDRETGIELERERCIGRYRERERKSEREQERERDI